jgi:hypothetical protein
LRVKSRKKNGEKWLLGFGHFFWAGVYVTVINVLLRKLTVYYVLL